MSALSSNSLDLSSVCDLVGVCPVCFANQIYIFSLPLVTLDVLVAMSSKVDFLPAGLLLFHVSKLYIVGYVHLAEWDFDRIVTLLFGRFTVSEEYYLIRDNIFSMCQG